MYKENRSCEEFAPWPIPIGAEFVHGVDSVANQLIEMHDDWVVHETFDLCAEPEEYPSRNSFVQRRRSFTLPAEQRQTSHIQVFVNGRCYPLKESPGNNECSDEFSLDRTHGLIRQAQRIWQALQTISERVDSGCTLDDIGHDMSLDEFVDDQLNGKEFSEEDTITIKHIIESMFSNTAATSNKFMGVHEASREEWNWEYTESNFRSEQCFAEFISYYLDEIERINQQSSLVNIAIKTDTPILEIRSSRHTTCEPNRPPICLKTYQNEAMECDKCIVAVPLSILKSQKLKFCGEYKLPREIQNAVDSIQMFSGMKAHILLKIGIDITHCSKLMKLTELFFCPGEIFSQIWLRRNETSVFLTGFCLANCRDQLVSLVSNRATESNESKEDVAKDLMLQQLIRIFERRNEQQTIFANPSSPSCSAFALHDWSDDEYVMGAYSSPSVGAGWQNLETNNSPQLEEKEYPTHRDFLAKPIKDSIWLAGEHVNVKTCATVQSAMESGDRAAREVLKSLLRKSS